MTDTTPQGKRIALVVGVNNSGEADHIANLKYAERDADELVRVLQRSECQFDDVTPLIGEQATSVAMQDTIVEMVCRHTTGDDLLLVSFSGHAVRVSPQRGADDLFLVTHDFHESRAQRNPSRFLSMRWLYENLHQTSDAINVVLLLDCCYAGNITSASPDPLVIDVRELIKNYDSDTGITNQPHHDHLRVILTATSYNQPAPEEHGQGMLTRHVLAALRGKVEEARDTMGNVTLQRLHDYLQQHMSNQSPYLIGSLTRPCILAYYPGLSAEALRERAAAARQQQQAADRHARLLALFADHRSFMHDRLESFVGRVDELAEIRQRIAAQQPSGGYVTITGQAGQGKSSIIAKLVDAYGPDTVAHHFIPFNPGPDHQVSLLRNIMARLILKYDLLDIYVASESRAALRDFFPRVLRELAAKGGQEVIFIDGLDQIESELTGERDLSFLPTDPPSGVVFVLGTRPDDTLKPLELLKPRYEYRLPNLSRDDFDLVLAHRGVTLAPGLADRFYNAMQRNALYLDLVAKELREADAADPETMITQLADNPDNLFSLSMHRLKRNATQWRTVIKPLLGILLASRQPLSQRSLRAIIGTIDADDLRDGLRCLGGLLARDGRGHVYLFHLKLYDFLRQNEAQPNKEYIFATDEEQSYHARLADWCAGGNGCLVAIWDDHKQNAAEHERRTYARQHYITHLYEARDWERLFTVLDDGAYGKAKVQWDPSTRSYALDLDLGRKAAAWHGWTLDEGIAQLPHLWCYSLLRCTLASRADSYSEELFEAMVLVGWKQRAIATAELLTDPKKKASVLCKIGLALSKQEGHEPEVREVLMQAAEIAREIGDVAGRLGSLLNVAATLASVGYVDEARTIPGKVGSEWERVLLQLQVEVILTQENPLDAVKDFYKLPPEAWRQPAVMHVLDEATRFIHSADSRNNELATEVMAFIAKVMVKAGRLEDAITIARAVDDKDKQAKALGEIASKQAQAGMVVEAMTTARMIEDEDEQTEGVKEYSYRTGAS